ncbi:MAG: acylphosphatase [Clostridium sp.]
MSRYLIIVEGRVQGVGFRYFATAAANKYKLTGTVRNMDNGMVEINIQGEEEVINKFIADIKQGNRFVRVDELSSKKIPLIENEKGFKIKY